MKWFYKISDFIFIIKCVLSGKGKRYMKRRLNSRNNARNRKKENVVTWQEQIQTMTEKEKEFMWETNMRMNKKFEQKGFYEDRHYVHFINQMRLPELSVFFQAGIVLSRDLGNKLTYMTIVSRLKNLNCHLEELKSRSERTLEEDKFLTKWQPIIEQAKEKNNPKLTEELIVLFLKFNEMYDGLEKCRGIYTIDGRFGTNFINVSQEQKDNLLFNIEQEFYKSLNSEEIESKEAFVDKVERKYYLSTFKTIKDDINENFAREMQDYYLGL